ncbi:AMP-binding enzyme family protein [Collimonas arenae]|uniref:AMP-binding enzyme family protein n=2 Tax=Collimonas arenae TaxID=279058 RepID=A0A127PRV8_9BURK|nr:AMP-binding enzyme family protein [Collimonas arenae]AMP10253.1 AMP-binding enzyme family protein [Collimonas arenae]
MLTALSALSEGDREQPFAWRDGEVLNYRWLLAQVAAWRDLLLLQPGSRFALYCADSAIFAAALFGAWQAGKTVYLPGDMLPATCANLSAVVDGYLGDFPVEYLPLAPAACASNDDVSTSQDFKVLLPDFPGLVIYTSGSTGEPQAVPKCLAQLSTEVASLEQLFGARIGAAEIIATVSHQHIYGLLFKILWPLTSGRVIHARHLGYLEELPAQLGERQSVLISSPAHLKRLPAGPSLFSSIRAVFSSGGPLPPEVAMEAGRVLGTVPVEVYGSSETGGVAWRQREAGNDDSWQVMPAVTWRIGAVGNVLEIRSPHLPDMDWFAMADQIQAVDEQRFQLKGRIDRIVKVEEKRISLDAIERQLKMLGAVTDARVLLLDGVDDQQRQRIAAFVVLSAAGRKMLVAQGKLALNRQLRDGVAHAVEAIALPRSWRYLDALPVNAQGKTTRADLLALLEPRSAASEPLHAPPTKPERRLLEQEAGRVLLELTVPKDLLYFNGHFDGAPILPGVAQLDWAIHYGRAYFALAPQFLGVQALKFQRVITPGMVVQLELINDTQKNCLTFRIASAAGQHASGRITFGVIDASA